MVLNNDEVQIRNELDQKWFIGWDQRLQKQLKIELAFFLTIGVYWRNVKQQSDFELPERNWAVENWKWKSVTFRRRFQKENWRTIWEKLVFGVWIARAKQNQQK